MVGNLVDDPELRFTPSGAAVANFRIASTPRTFDRQTNEWKDGDALFLSCSVWRQAAENVAESLQRGMRVVVQGRLQARVSTRPARARSAPSSRSRSTRSARRLKYATAKVTRTTRSGGGGGYSGGGQRSAAAASAGRRQRPVGHAGGASRAAPGGQGGGRRPAAPANDPWGAPGVSSDEPPF